MSATGTKQTSPSALHMSASDPKRKLGAMTEMQLTYCSAACTARCITARSTQARYCAQALRLPDFRAAGV